MRTVVASVVGGLVAGVLDISYALLAYGLKGVKPIVILQSIASGLLGQDAYAGGARTALLGGGLHFLMTIAMAAGFLAVARAFPALLRSPIRAGTVYGLVLFALMNYAVVPLSAAYPGTPPQAWLLGGALFAHGMLVGVPIALSGRHFLARQG